MNAAIGGLPGPTWIVRDHWGCREEQIRASGLHACNVTQIFKNNTSIRWERRWRNYATQSVDGSFIVLNMLVLQLVPRLLCMVAVDTFPWMTFANHQPRKWSTISGRNRMIMVRRSTQIHDAFQLQTQASKISQRKLEWKMMRQQRYLPVVRNCAPGLVTEFEQIVVTEAAETSQRWHDDIVNCPALGFLPNTTFTSSCEAVYSSLWEWNTLAEWFFKNLRCG